MKKVFWSFLAPILIGVYGALGWTLGARSTLTERDALKATITALREDGDGSCAVKNNGPHVLCWMEDGRIKYATAPVKLLKRRRGP